MEGLSENNRPRLRTLPHQPEVDVRQILAEAQSRWLRPLEVCEILSNYAKYGFKLNPVPPVRPCCGSMFLFDRKTLRYFRKDGHKWRKKKDGKTVREAHERLKTGSVDVLHCYYAHGEENSNFQRRCYWMLDPALEHIVLVHYREVTEASRFSMADCTTSAHSSPAPSPLNQHVANSPDLSGGLSDLDHDDGDVAESDEVDNFSSMDISASLSFNHQQQQPPPPSLLEQIAPPPPQGAIDSRTFVSWSAPAPLSTSSAASFSSPPSSSLVGMERLLNFPSVYSTGAATAPSMAYVPQPNGQQQQQHPLQVDNLGRSKHESSTSASDTAKPPILASPSDVTVWNELLENSQRNQPSLKNQKVGGMMGGEAVYMKQESMSGSTWAEMLEQCTTPATRHSMLEAIMGNSSLEVDGGPEAGGNNQDFLFGSLVPSPKGILEAFSPRGLGREPQTPLEASLRAVTEQKALQAAAEAQQRRSGGTPRTDSQSNDALWDAKAAEVGFPKLRSFNNPDLGNFAKFDSFGRWMSNELGGDGQNFLPSGPSHSGWSLGLGMFEDQGVVNDDMYSLSQQMQVETVLNTLVSQDQRYSIVDFLPEWAYPSGETKVIITGMFIGDYSSSSKEHKWCCMFGELEVPAEVIGAGVLRCKAPPHAVGRVLFYVTCGDRQAHSEIREFEYCSAAAVGLAAAKSGLKTDEEMMFKVRLARMLLAESNTQSASPDYITRNRDSVLSDAEWSYLEDLAKGSGDSQAFNFQEKLLQMLLKSDMHKWLLSKVQEEGKGPSILDEQGQGVFHMAAALGYDWAVAPLVAAGIPINFRDVHGWTALHWAASYCREEVVIALLKAGADPVAVTDPTRTFTAGQTPADLAGANGHRGMAGFLALANLERRLSSMSLSENPNPMDIAMSHIAGDNAVAKLSRRESIRRSLSGEEDPSFLAESLQAVRDAARVAALINTTSQRLSLQQKQEDDSLVDEFGMTPYQLRGLMAARTAQKFQNAFPGHRERKQQLAATRIQQKYRGWKQRRDFLDLRQRVVRLQAQVRGNQVRKRLKKLLWSVGILEKAVLRWRRKGAGLRGFKSGELSVPDKGDDDDDEELIKDGRKKNEAAVEKAVTRVQSMVRSRQARAQYIRLRDGSLQQGQFSQLAGPQEFLDSTEEQLAGFQHLQQHQGQSLQPLSPQGFSDIMEAHLMNFPN